MLEHFIEELLPPVISLLELIGIFVVIHGALGAFWQYLRGVVTRRPSDFKLALAEGLAAGLEFKMAAEILKTVIIRTPEELVILGAVILLRALLSLVIHWEMKAEFDIRRRMEGCGDEPPV